MPITLKSNLYVSVENIVLIYNTVKELWLEYI